MIIFFSHMGINSQVPCTKLVCRNYERQPNLVSEKVHCSPNYTSNPLSNNFLTSYIIKTYIKLTENILATTSYATVGDTVWKYPQSYIISVARNGQSTKLQ
jgi:hypothetical protein